MRLCPSLTFESSLQEGDPGDIQKPQLNWRPRAKALWLCYSNKHVLLWNPTLTRPSVYLEDFIRFTEPMDRSAAFFGSPGTHGEAKVCNSVSSHGKWSKKPQSEEYPVTLGGRHPCLLLRPLPKALQGYVGCTPLYFWRQSLELLIKPNKICGWGVPLAYHFSCHLFKIKLFEISDQKGVVPTNHYHVI